MINIEKGKKSPKIEKDKDRRIEKERNKRKGSRKNKKRRKEIAIIKDKKIRIDKEKRKEIKRDSDNAIRKGKKNAKKTMKKIVKGRDIEKENTINTNGHDRLINIIEDPNKMKKKPIVNQYKKKDKKIDKKNEVISIKIEISLGQDLNHGKIG